MPRLNDDLQTYKTGNYGFSATRIEDLGASEFTLVAIVTDISPSVSGFEHEMEECDKEVVKACLKSPRADNLMIRNTHFNSKVTEFHGFKLLSAINPDDYTNSLRLSGGTALYDAMENAISSMAAYGKDLIKNEFGVNGIAIVITDGDDNSSTLGVNDVVRAMKDAMQQESLESLVTILVGVNIQNAAISSYLKKLQVDVGFTQYVELKDAKASTLAKLAAFVSKSISSQSQALGTGGASQQIPPSLTI